MTTELLHPEELLDRERLGALDEDGRRALDAHTRVCAACALERRARSGLTAELAPEATDEAVLDRVLERALEAGPASRRRPRFRWIWLAAAATLVGAVALAAGVSRYRRAPAPPPAPIEAAPALAPAPQPTLESAPVAPEPSAEPEAAEPESSAKKSERVPSAAELFAGATRARRDKNDAEAIRLYRELERRYPDSREAKASQVVLGQLLLDKTDPEKALGEFNGYLSDGGKGAVTEEALVGRALALQKLGRKNEERAAWQELLAKFPNSVHAAQARDRIGATGP